METVLVSTFLKNGRNNMIELQGKHNNCKVFTDNVDSTTIGQLTALLNQESVSDSKGCSLFLG